MKLQSITINENQDGAVVEILLCDAPQLDDADEYLSFLLKVEYQQAENPSLEMIKELAFAKARAICTEQAKAARKVQDDF